MTSERARQSRITVRRYSSAAEADRHDLEFWMRLPDAERVLQAWRLSQQIWRLRGDPPHERRSRHLDRRDAPRTPSG